MDTWRNCKSCRKRYSNIGSDGMCADCHNAVIDAQAAAAGKQPPRPPWCGMCSDERIRQVEVPRRPALIDKGYSETVIARCPRCHPLAPNRLRSVA